MHSGGFLLRPRPRVSRRRWLGYSLAVTGATVAGFVFGRTSVPRPARADARLDWARLLARRGSIEELLDYHLAFLQLLDSYPRDETLWSGVQRLAIAVLESPEPAKVAAIARRVSSRLDSPWCPAETRRLRPRLQRLER